MTQERGEETKAALIQAAAATFGHSGYQRTTLKNISDAANMSKGAISFHFDNKEDLAAAVRREACSRTDAAVEALHLQDEPPLQTLINITHLMAHHLAHDPLSRGAVRLVHELGAPPDSQTDPLSRWWAALTDTARKAEKAGALPAGTSDRLVDLLFPCLAYNSTQSASDVRERVTSHWELLLNGLDQSPTTDHLRLMGTAINCSCYGEEFTN